MLQDVMIPKRKWIIPAMLTIFLLLALAALILHGHSGRWRCYRNLMVIDHYLNCHGCIQMGRSDGIVDSEGNWKMDESNWLLTSIGTNQLHCPVSGQKYNVTYVVGTYPACPTHGDLIRFYGSVPHGSTLRSVFLWFAPTVSFFGAIGCGIWTLVSFMIAARRKRKEDHNNSDEDLGANRAESSR